MRFPESLILFARAPRPGKAKTRLIPALGAEGAAALYRAFLADAAGTARELRAEEPAVGLFSEWSRTEGGPEAGFSPSAWLPGPFLHRAQTGLHLGSRMAAALGRRLAFGGPAILIGTDFPDLPPEILSSAFSLLRSGGPNNETPKKAVIGPAKDGGYYLIGLTRPAPGAFEGIAWGKPDVFRKTVEKLKTLEFEVAVLPEWQDVDAPEDLAALRARLRKAGPGIAPRTRRALAELPPETE